MSLKMRPGTPALYCLNSRRIPFQLLIGLLTIPVSALAQIAPKASSSIPETSKRGDAVVNLAPFEVQADSDSSYGALNSNSITSFNTELNKMPLSADIFNRAFMDD